MLDSQVTNVFDDSMVKAGRLIDDLGSKKINSVSKMQGLILQESALSQLKLSEQLGTIGVLRNAIQNNVKLPRKLLVGDRMSEDQQIVANQLILLSLAGKRQKQ